MNTYLKITILNIFLLCVTDVFSQGSYTVSKIWDKAPHNAFTDLIKYDDKFYCAFREGGGHNPTSKSLVNGKIRLLSSKDGVKWQSVALLEKEGVDLRDSKLSITPDNRLMILAGGSYYAADGKLMRRHTQVAFMNFSGKITKFIPVNIDPNVRTDVDWLWRVTWDKRTDRGYGVVTQGDSSGKRSSIILVNTSDGINYQYVDKLKIDGAPNESTVQFMDDGTMRLIVRRENGDKMGRVGYGNFPYRDWQWFDLGFRLGGPNVITLPNGKTIVGSRFHPTSANFPAHTMLYLLKEDQKLEKCLQLTSEGDTSYMGFLINDDELWVSYYSTHEGKTSIYLAKVKLSFFDQVNLY
jgi:hypothetical protein